MISSEDYDIKEAKLNKLASYLNEETEVYGMEVGDSICIDGWFTIPQLLDFAKRINDNLADST